MKTFLQSLFITCITIFTISCNENTEKQNSTTINHETLSKVEGGRYSGGILKINSTSKITSLFPASISDVYSQHVSSQIFEGLLKYNQKTLEVEPCIAESYTINEINTIYTFKLRENIFFHNNKCFEDGKGRKVTATDFKNVFEFLCSKDELNKSGYLISEHIKGSQEFAEGKTNDLEGVRVINDNTFELELNEPFSGITNILALTQTSVFPQEALDLYKSDISNNPVGSGPYQLETNGEQIILIKNNSYWKKDEYGNQLPYISKIKINFEGNKTKELANFNDGKIDFVWGVPVEEIPNVMGTLDEAREGKNREFILQSINSLQTQYYGFNLNNEIFNNKKLRQAFNYAINKDSIVNNILQGEGTASINGIIPKMKNYQNEKIKGYEYNPEKAKRLLKEAGYPDGKGLPIIELPISKKGQINELMAQNLKKYFKNILNIDLKLVDTDSREINTLREDGKIDFWRFGWIADYPDPSNFIAQFHSKYIIEGQEKSYNYARYSNPEFDSYLDKAMYETNEEKRMDFYLKAEQILIDDAVIIPLYYASEIRLISPQLKNFPINEIEFRDFSVCYFTPKVVGKKVRVYDNL